MSVRTFLWMLLALALGGGSFLFLRNRTAPVQPPDLEGSNLPPSFGRINNELAREYWSIESRERKVAQTIWSREMLAQECGRTIEKLWDDLNGSTNKLALLAAFPLGSIRLSEWTNAGRLPHDIEMWKPDSSKAVVLHSNDWSSFLARQQSNGWGLSVNEFRQVKFETDSNGLPNRSTFYFSAHLTNSLHSTRVVLEGDLLVRWGGKQTGVTPWPIAEMDASQLSIRSRSNAVPFELVLNEHLDPPRNTHSLDPLLVYDLDGDGLSEIILANKNLLFRRSNSGYVSEPFSPHHPGIIYTAVIGDFDGDGAADFLSHRLDGLILLRGTPEGKFLEAGKRVWPAPPDCKHPMVLSCGDIDHDGDLDVFFAQYKIPYGGGSLPTPFYDANDGNRSYLLLNKGDGTFTDRTQGSGLEPKRKRHTYSASFVDLNADSHLDLVVVSDFAGIDVYQNNGQGRFSDVTSKWIDESHAFGMAHSLADFNVDGVLDILMTGMTSATVDRLEHLGLYRADSVIERTMRPRMVEGNRLYLGEGTGGYLRTALSSSIARSGWSWGCTSFDLENDGFPDVYIVNGLTSNETVRDYEPEYWLHDRYVAGSVEKPAVYLYIKAKFGRTRGSGHSYGGYEKNRLFLNQGGASFFEAAHLFGLGLEDDSTNLVSDDLDGDGLVDLIMTLFERNAATKQTLRVYQNKSNLKGHWIGLRFKNRPGEPSPMGVQARVYSGGKVAVRQIVTGDSYRSQHPTTLHFGVGQAAGIEKVEIRWVDGRTLTIKNPPLDQYQEVRAPRSKP